MAKLSFWKEFGQQLVARDGMQCQYCGIEVFDTDTAQSLYGKVEQAQQNNRITWKDRNALQREIQDRIATVDHVIPVCRGGAKFGTDNMVVCCFRCNVNKNVKTGQEYLAELAQQ